MRTINTKIAFKAVPSRIDFKYTIEDNIYDVDMLICIFIKKAVENKIKLSEIIIEFTKGDNNDQYKMFEKTFIDLFKDDGVAGFEDYESAYNRAKKIVKQSSMIYDVNSSIETFWLSEIEMHQIQTSNGIRYLSSDEIPTLIKNDVNYFINKKEHIEKKPKFISVDKIEGIEKEYEKAIDIEMSEDFNSFYIDGIKFENEDLIKKSVNEFKQITTKMLNQISSEKSSLKNVNKLNDDTHMLLTKIENKKTISKFNSNFTLTNDDIVVEFDNGKFKIFNFYKYKGIVVYDEEYIDTREFMNRLNIKKRMNFNNDVLNSIIDNIQNSKEFEIIEKYISDKENNFSDKQIRKLFGDKFELLFESDISILDDVTYSRIIARNDLSKMQSFESKYKFIMKHSRKSLNNDDEITLRFLYDTYTENNNMLDKKHSSMVKEYIKDKDVLKTKIDLIKNKASDLRSILNRITEELKEKDIKVDSKIDLEQAEIRKYLNRVVHIVEKNDRNNKILEKYPELNKWVQLFESEFDFEYLTQELIEEIDLRVSGFERFIKFYSKIK